MTTWLFNFGSWEGGVQGFRPKSRDIGQPVQGSTLSRLACWSDNTSSHTVAFKCIMCYKKQSATAHDQIIYFLTIERLDDRKKLDKYSTKPTQPTTHCWWKVFPCKKKKKARGGTAHVYISQCNWSPVDITHIYLSWLHWCLTSRRPPVPLYSCTIHGTHSNHFIWKCRRVPSGKGVSSSSLLEA